MASKIKKTKIMVFGTFDGLHQGHLSFFNQARKLAELPYLIISIARDKNIKKIKGEFPQKGEQARLRLLKKSKLADRVVLSSLEDHIQHITEEHPDIIALGYDQSAYVKNLKTDLKNKGLEVEIVRLKPYKENIYKNHLLKKKR